jgi:sec-independent protein translocase protein TatA
VFSGLLQPTHLIILAILALIFLGPKRLPEAGRALGQGLKEFKHSIGGGHDDDHQIPAHTAVAPAVAPAAAPEEKAPTP